MPNKEEMRFLDIMSREGCSFCGNRFTDIYITEDGRPGVVKYNVCCPNCGVERRHILVTGFTDNESAFAFLNKALRA